MQPNCSLSPLGVKSGMETLPALSPQLFQAIQT